MRRRPWLRIEGRTIRPWLTGLAALALLIWWISWLFEAQKIGSAEDDDEIVTAATVSPDPTQATVTGSDAPPLPLSDLLPLGPEDEGFRVQVRGTVVGEPIDDGFWILTDEDEVLFARQGFRAESGQDLTLTGTLKLIATAEGNAWAERARLRGAAGWKVHYDLYLEVDPNRQSTGAEGAETAPAGDTT